MGYNTSQYSSPSASSPGFVRCLKGFVRNMFLGHALCHRCLYELIKMEYIEIFITTYFYQSISEDKATRQRDRILEQLRHGVK